MKTYTSSEKGFTLVELAVVMIIIGLLIGGVLKGQELIKNAKVTSTISQVKSLDAAASTFQDIYAGLPGDLLNPGARMPNCTGTPCVPTAGTQGNGEVEATADFDPSAGDEAQAFFVHLAASDLLSGVVPGADSFGSNYPEAPVGGGWMVMTATAQADLPGVAGTDTTIGSTFRRGLYLMHQNSVGDTGTGASNAVTMQRIDRKIDDGNPLSGTVYAVEQTAATCTVDDGSSGASNTYNTASGAYDCSAIIRIQN